MLENLTPALPTVADMLGAHCEVVYSRPFQRQEIIETGIVIGYQERNGELFLRFRPDNPCKMVKWVSEGDFRAYVAKLDSPFTAVAAYAAAMQGDYKSYLKITGGMTAEVRSGFWLWAREEARQKQAEAAVETAA